jgi:small subunit ribosomal protein S2e
MGDRGGFGRGFGRGDRGDRGDRGRGRRGRPRGRKDEEEKWVPVTKLGRLVQQASLTHNIYHRNLCINDLE